MGPAGMRELGENILINTNYAIETLKTVPRVKVNPSGSANFQEFVVDFTDSGKTVKEVNAALLKEGIFGGKDLSEDFPELGQSALYCVSELTTQSDIERLRDAFLKVSEGR